jgi:hypothetical protein
MQWLGAPSLSGRQSSPGPPTSRPQPASVAMCLLELDMEGLECCRPTAIAGLRRQCAPLHQIGADMCADNSL